MKSGEARRLERRPLTGTWFRALSLAHWATRLKSAHSRTSSSRFSSANQASPGYRITYFGQTHQVAIHEVYALLGNPVSPVANPKGSWVILSLEVILDNVVDLSDPNSQKVLKTNHEELTGNWNNSRQEVPTQSLGRSLYELPDLEGFIFPSSLVDGLCLSLFPDKLGARSSITFLNEMTNRQERMT